MLPSAIPPLRKEAWQGPTWGVRTAAVVDIRENNSLLPDMKFIAISGSLRANASNTALLRRCKPRRGPNTALRSQITHLGSHLQITDIFTRS
jgi:hypothetical protein